jgi:branched-chain amino acid transport system substrate-binding protein
MRSSLPALRAVARTTTVALVLLAFAPLRTIAADPYPIDVILPLTGGAAFAGEAQQQVLRLYEGSINKTGGIHGRPLHFEIHDDQSNPVVAVQIVNELLPKKPTVILGPSVAATCSAISAILAKGPGTVNYCFSPVVPPPPGGYVFAATSPALMLLANDVAHMRNLGFKRAALIISTDASGTQNAAVFETLFARPENASMKLVAEERFNPTALSAAAQIAKIKAADPDVVLMYANGTAFLTGLRELKNSGIDVPVTTNPFNGDGALLVANRNILPKTLFIQGLPYQGKNPTKALRDTGAEYLSVFRDAGIKSASVIQAYCWDPTKITIAALRALPDGANAMQLHDYLEKLHDFPGLFGTYDFRSGDNYGLSGEEAPFVKWDANRADWIPY